SKSSAKALYEQRKKYSNSNFIMHETSQYHVEHLSTFIMDKAESIVTVDDAIKKLVLLDSKDKIWTQEVLLQVTDKAVRLLDCDTQEELENFPLSIIHLSQTVLNKTRYPSVLLLICQDKDQHKPDIHFFHCDEVDAEIVHADIDSAIGDNKHGKKMRPQTLKVNQEKMKHRRETILPPAAPAPAAKGRVATSSLFTRGAIVCVLGADRRGSGKHEPESHDKLIQRIEIDVQVLNCTLDDIEVFMSRLQKAAEAFAQLNHRNKSKKNKKKGPAEGMLTLRAKPPSEAEFIDSLQKLKLAFNLLAKLKKHIENPSASELVHFLFGPLEMVLKTLGSPDLARSIVSPHLSRDTVDFLLGHLTPKETGIFELLGDGWTKPRAEWPRDRCAPPYFPKFRNGWEAPVDYIRAASWETEGPPEALGPPTSPVYRQQSAEDVRTAELSLLQPAFPLSDLSYRVRHRSFPPFLAHVHTPVNETSPVRSYNGMSATTRKYAKICYQFVARNANELSVLQDEVLEVIEDGKQWWKLRNRSGQTGYVPFNVLEVVKAEVSGAGRRTRQHILSLARRQKSFSLRPKTNLFWRKYKPVVELCSCVCGVCVRSKASGRPLLLRSETASTRGDTKTNVSKRLNKRRTARRSVSAAGMDEVNTELLLMITANKSQPPVRKLRYERPSGIQVPLTYESNTEQVTAWLSSKGFSKPAVECLGILTGAQLFSLNKDELRAVCGDEGSRIYSQITVQKEQVEQKCGSSELQEVLSRRQQNIRSSSGD
uniref:Epidermal growth factor receptor kinase substrate 8-like protein 2 n=1 Tax=Tetraodon nigroviridis TaxID=99883 RepID=H3DF71_TETNG